MKSADEKQTIISIGHNVDAEGNWVAMMFVSGFDNEQDAIQCCEVIKTMFCGIEIEVKQ